MEQFMKVSRGIFISSQTSLWSANETWSFALLSFCCQAVGMPYLHEVLKPIINRIFDEKRYIELDPCKIHLNRR